MNEKQCTRLVRNRALSIGGVDMFSWLGLASPPCECCGQREGTERDHRKNRSQGGLWLPSNIVLLCFMCHRWKTVNPLAAHHAGYAVRSHEEPHRVPLKLWYTEAEVYLDDKGGFDSNLPAEDNAGHGS